MKDDTQPGASKVTYVQSENIIYSLEFVEANFCLKWDIFVVEIKLSKLH